MFREHYVNHPVCLIRKKKIEFCLGILAIQLLECYLVSINIIIKDMKHIHTQFHKHFKIQRVNNPRSLEEAFRLRYQVYCQEQKYEDPANFPDGMEKDDFDRRADHSIIRYRDTDQVVGTVRLVLPSNDRDALFPIEKYFDLGHKDITSRLSVDRSQIGEVSRVAISNEYRKALDGVIECNSNEARFADFLYTHTVVGLISAVIHMSLDHNLTHWVCFMEPSLHRLLSRFGLRLKPFGPVSNIRGQRRPYYAVIGAELERIRMKYPSVWRVITHDCDIFQSHVEHKLVSTA